jgi:hypothetical protein
MSRKSLERYFFRTVSIYITKVAAYAKRKQSRERGREVIRVRKGAY